MRKIVIFNTALIGLTIFVTGCATKGPKKVYATPVQPPVRVVSPTVQAVNDAPRTQPGKIMDPDAVTYAQVPSRIIYLPGQHGIFSRSSAKQEVAYNLVPVDRIKAVQAEATPEFGEVLVRENVDVKVKDVIETSFMNEDGSTVKGTARRLGVLGQNDVEKQRAENLLRRGEELRWSADMGWVGFFPEKKAKPYRPAKEKETSIPPLELGDISSKRPADIEPIGDRDTLNPIKEDSAEAEISLELDGGDESIEEEIDLTID
jgi:hypothetical protein